MVKRTKTNASAKVVDGSLILTLPDAKNPVVWRMALGEARAAAIEVVPRNSEYALILKTPKGDATDIAPFDTKEQATDALMIVSRAMEQSEGRTRITTSSSGATTVQKDGPVWKWLIPLALILAALFFFSRTASMTAPVETTDTVGTPSTVTGDVGVPLSADSYLGGF